MLTFDNRFEISNKDGNPLLWADEPSLGRVLFYIDPVVLEDSLQIGHQLQDCERERRWIEEACQQAFADRPSNRIGLQSIDFQ